MAAAVSSRIAGMASKKLYQTYPSLKLGVNRVQQEIFGYYPNIGVRSGAPVARKPLTGVFLARYYDEPIEKSARLVRYNSMLLMIYPIVSFIYHTHAKC
jgi:hypothetical protein